MNTKKSLTEGARHFLQLTVSVYAVTLIFAFSTYAGVIHNGVPLPLNITPKKPPEIQYVSEKMDVASKVDSGKFEALNSEADFYLTNRSRSATGNWKLSQFFIQLSNHFNIVKKTPNAWSQLQRQLLNNAMRNAKSESAWLIYATALDVEAWRLRGDGLNNTTTKKGRADFVRTLELERNLLDGHTKLFENNPEWYVMRTYLALYLGEGREKVDQLFNSGIKVERDYQNLYHAALFSRTPRWGGSVDAMAQFFEHISSTPSPSEGISIYSRLMLNSRDAAYELRKDPRISWDLMKRSFVDVLTKFPDDGNSQLFFIAACDKGDKETALSIAKHIKNAPSREILNQQFDNFAGCFDWAFNNTPMYFRDPDTGANILVQ